MCYTPLCSSRGGDRKYFLASATHPPRQVCIRLSISSHFHSFALFKKECSDKSFAIKAFRTLLQNTGGGTLPARLFSAPISSRIAICFRIRTSEKRARNSSRIRTSKTQDLKPFRMCTYRKRGRGEAPKGVCPERGAGARDLFCTRVQESSLSLPRYFLTSLLPVLASVKQIRLLARDAVPQRLELEPPDHGHAHLRVRQLRRFVRNFARLSRGFRQQLRLARAVHGDEPPRRFVHGLPDRQQSVIAQNGRFLVAQLLGDAVAFVGFVDHAGEIVKHHVILVKRASILRQGIEQPPQRRPRLSVERVRVRRRNHVGTRFMNSRVDRERRGVYFPLAFHHFAVIVD